MGKWIWAILFLLSVFSAFYFSRKQGAPPETVAPVKTPEIVKPKADGDSEGVTSDLQTGSPLSGDLRPESANPPPPPSPPPMNSPPGGYMPPAYEAPPPPPPPPPQYPEPVEPFNANPPPFEPPPDGDFSDSVPPPPPPQAFPEEDFD